MIVQHQAIFFCALALIAVNKFWQFWCFWVRAPLTAFSSPIAVYFAALQMLLPITIWRGK
jgi:hypothetical protein